jgi:hypothetical protein
MERVDRLILKATRLKPAYDDLFIISNETGMWKVGTEEFQSLEDAEQYIKEITGDNDVLMIINDAGPGVARNSEGKAGEHGENPVENANPGRGAPNIGASCEHGGERRDGQQNSKYHHSWV